MSTIPLPDMLREMEIQDIVQRIVRHIKPDKIIVFGSYAKNTATLKSDLDLFIVKNSEMPMSLRAANIKPLVAHLLIHVDIHVYTPEEIEAYSQEEFCFVKSVMQTGRVVFDNNK